MSGEGHKRKGQFIIIGAIAIIFMLTLVTLARAPLRIEAVGPEKPIFDNLRTESRELINVILAENANSTNLENRLLDWAHFAGNYSRRHATLLRGYFVVALPSGQGLNVTIMNFMGSAAIVNVTANSSAGSASLAAEEAKTITFASVSDSFDFSYNFSVGGEVDSKSLNVTRRAFAAIKTRITSGEQVYQSLDII